MNRSFTVLALIFALALPVLAEDTVWRQEVEAFRKERVEDLKKEDGWFTLVGLAWLDEGENRFGSDPEAKVALPEGKAPKLAGVLVRKGDAVSLRLEPGVKMTSGGKPVKAGKLIPLVSDIKGEPTVLQMGTVSFHVIQRGDMVGVRVKDTKSAALAAFHDLDTYPIQPAWRVEARFEPYDPPRTIGIPNILGQVTDSPAPGAVVFDWQGKTYRLDALGDPKEGLSLIFADQTNGKETYGAGRFLETGPVKDGKVFVDFNLAYNPPCAFTAFATCPLPPAQNRLALRVEAGEKKYAGSAH
ncbi:MAG TPA: DUF1684 domain-containing protein [Thermoanaerobaculia bacterium]|jgi:uncharacterized protein (DUF1684 family)|nr:DUF1684 domain-containing protein [Thermoanaerobaculia bacterium]